MEEWNEGKRQMRTWGNENEFLCVSLLKLESNGGLKRGDHEDSGVSLYISKAVVGFEEGQK